MQDGHKRMKHLLDIIMVMVDDCTVCRQMYGQSFGTLPRAEDTRITLMCTLSPDCFAVRCLAGYIYMLSVPEKYEM